MRVAEGARFSVVFVAGHVPVAILPVKSMRMGEKKAWYPASLIRLLILVWLAYGEDGAAQGRVDVERRGARPVGAQGQAPQVVAGFGPALPDRAGVCGGTVEQGGGWTGRHEPADGGQVAGPVPRVEVGRPVGRAEAGQAERLFAEITRRMLQRSDQRSDQTLERDVREWVRAWNENPGPSNGTRPPTRSSPPSPDSPSAPPASRPPNSTTNFQRRTLAYISARGRSVEFS